MLNTVYKPVCVQHIQFHSCLQNTILHTILRIKKKKKKKQAAKRNICKQNKKTHSCSSVLMIKPHVKNYKFKNRAP